jgi:predicted nuclease with TOPRIM domain
MELEEQVAALRQQLLEREQEQEKINEMNKHFIAKFEPNHEYLKTHDVEKCWFCRSDK